MLKCRESWRFFPSLGTAINWSYAVSSLKICGKRCDEEMPWSAWKRLVRYWYWIRRPPVLYFRPDWWINPFLVDADIRPVITAFGIRWVLLLFYVLYVQRISERTPYTEAVLNAAIFFQILPRNVWSQAPVLNSLAWKLKKRTPATRVCFTPSLITRGWRPPRSCFFGHGGHRDTDHRRCRCYGLVGALVLPTQRLRLYVCFSS